MDNAQKFSFACCKGFVMGCIWSPNFTGFRFCCNVHVDYSKEKTIIGDQ